jgi:hypothetical protein
MNTYSGHGGSPVQSNKLPNYPYNGGGSGPTYSPYKPPNYNAQPYNPLPKKDIAGPVVNPGYAAQPYPTPGYTANLPDRRVPVLPRVIPGKSPRDSVNDSYKQYLAKLFLEAQQKQQIQDLVGQYIPVNVQGTGSIKNLLDAMDRYQPSNMALNQANMYKEQILRMLQPYTAQQRYMNVY